MGVPVLFPSSSVVSVASSITVGNVERQSMEIVEATNPGFVDPAVEAIVKSRYQPA